MAEFMQLAREAGGGKYEDVMDVAERLGKGDYGSASNALCVMARQSPLFQEKWAEIERERQEASTPAGRKALED